MKLNVQTKNAQIVFVTFMESERRKNNCYLAFGDKNDDFSLFGTFSKIEQDNALQAFTIYQFHFFEAFRFLLVKSQWRGGENSLTNPLRCTTMQSF